jgi:hypothetical protein
MDERDTVGRGAASSEAELCSRGAETLERGGTSLGVVETLERGGDGVRERVPLMEGPERWLGQSLGSCTRFVPFWFVEVCLQGFLRYTIRPIQPVEKRLVCNRKGPICKNPTVEINSIRLIF